MTFPVPEQARLLNRDSPGLEKLAFFAVLWAPFAVLVNESDVIAYNPVARSLGRRGHEKSLRLEKLHLVFVSHGLFSDPFV
jgi:hypothetical protein